MELRKLKVTQIWNWFSKMFKRQHIDLTKKIKEQINSQINF